MAIIPVPYAMTRYSKVTSFQLQRATAILRSRYTGQAQRLSYPYAVWMLEAALIECDGIAAGQIRSFLAQLEGQKNSFRLPVPGYKRPTTGYGVNLGAYATAARASSMPCYGALGNTPILNEGDYITVQDELKIITAAVASASDGKLTLNFKPALRKAIPANTEIILVNPTVLMTAQDDDVAKWSIGPPVRQLSNFAAVEALDI